MESQPGDQAERADEVHHRLIALLLEGGGLAEVARELSARMRQSVLIADAAGVILAGQLSPSAQTRFAEVMRRLAHDERRAGQWLASYTRQAQLCLVPLVVQNGVEGWLVTEVGELDSPDRLTLEQGATVTTLALIKHRAVQEAEQRLRRDLLEDLLTNERWSVGRLSDQARLLGWQLDSKPVVILLDFSEVRRYALSEHGRDQSRLRWLREQFLKLVQQVIAERGPLSIVVERGDGLIILPHFSDADAQGVRDQAQDLLDSIAQQVRAAGLNVSYAIAGGGFHSGVEGLRRSFREAQQALEIGLRLMMRRPIWFDEVHLYLLLEQFSRSEEVREWFRSTLGPLTEYDRRNRTQMTHTVEVYFDASQSLHQAALELHIHPNTLKYRLQRIKQLLGQDPFAGENQLQFYLATKVARLLE
jgi:purine catabolism regulator